MKILVLANNDVGLYQFRRELLLKLLEQHKVYISLPDGDLVRSLELMGCTFIDTSVDRRGINPLNDFRLFMYYCKMLRNIKPELVITYTIKPNVYGGTACRVVHIPYAVNITGLGTAFQNPGALRRLVTAMYKIALKGARTVFFENAENRRVLLDEHIVKASQTCLLNGAGVNLEHYAMTEYPADMGTIRFLFIGRVMKEKGVDELFAAMERLQCDHISCSLDVLGSMEENYAAVIEKCVAAGWLHYHGYQQDVRPFIAQSHCFVLPSYHEGMANTNLECASMGRPLITSRIHGCMEAVIEGKSGLLCEPKDADSLYDAMRRFCDIPNEQRKTMGKAGRRHMEEMFDKAKVIERTMKGLGL